MYLALESICFELEESCKLNRYIFLQCEIVPITCDDIFVKSIFNSNLCLDCEKFMLLLQPIFIVFVTPQLINPLNSGIQTKTL